MSQFSYDLAVAYRIYPESFRPSRPPIFAEDKFKLAELCFKSFKGSLGGLRVKLWVLLNNCPPEYEAMFPILWAGGGFGSGAVSGRCRRAPRCTNRSRILAEQTDAEICFFWKTTTFICRANSSWPSIFCGKSRMPILPRPTIIRTITRPTCTNVPREIRQFGGKQWRFCISTTHTFLARRAALIESRKFSRNFFESF